MLAASSKDGDIKLLHNIAFYIPIYMTACADNWNLATINNTKFTLEHTIVCPNLAFVNRI
jgi:hypothetical protein